MQLPVNQPFDMTSGIDFEKFKDFIAENPTAILDAAGKAVVSWMHQGALRSAIEFSERQFFFDQRQNAKPLGRLICDSLRKDGFKVDNSLSTYLGEQTAKHVCTIETGPFDWTPGSFGDNDSCFWGIDRIYLREMMHDQGFLVMKVRTQHGKGIGRCWLWPMPDGALLFNPYCVSLEMMGGALARILDKPYTWVRACNHGSCSETLYINSGTGILIGEAPTGACEDGEDEDYEACKCFDFARAGFVSPQVECGCEDHNPAAFWMNGGKWRCSKCHKNEHYTEDELKRTWYPDETEQILSERNEGKEDESEVY